MKRLLYLLLSIVILNKAYCSTNDSSLEQTYRHRQLSNTDKEFILNSSQENEYCSDNVNHLNVANTLFYASMVFLGLGTFFCTTNNNSESLWFGNCFVFTGFMFLYAADHTLTPPLRDPFDETTP